MTMRGIRIDIKKTLCADRRRFDLHIRFSCEDSWLALFGPSGAGKTLTLRALAGLLTPDSGTIEVDGQCWFDSQEKINVPTVKRRIGYLFQDYALFPHLTVAANVAFGLKPNGIGRLKRAERKQVEETLDIFEIGPLANCYPRALSGGQRQRTALARALIGRPSLLLLDEPFAALDPLLRRRMRCELKRVRTLFDIPVVMITHDPEDLKVLAQTVITIDDGRVTSEIGDYQKMKQKVRWLSETPLPVIKEQEDDRNDPQCATRRYRRDDRASQATVCY